MKNQVEQLKNEFNDQISPKLKDVTSKIEERKLEIKLPQNWKNSTTAEETKMKTQEKKKLETTIDIDEDAFDGYDLDAQPSG